MTSLDFCDSNNWYIGNNPSNTLPTNISTINLTKLSRVVIQQIDYAKIDGCFKKSGIEKLLGVNSIIGNHITFSGGIFNVGSVECSSGLSLVNGATLIAQGENSPNITISVSRPSGSIILNSLSNISPIVTSFVTGIGTITADQLSITNSFLQSGLLVSTKSARFMDNSVNQADIAGESFFENSQNNGTLTNYAYLNNSVNSGTISGPMTILTNNSQNFKLITSTNTVFAEDSINRTSGKIRSNTIFDRGSTKNQGLCSGTTQFYNSRNDGLVIGQVIFSGSVNSSTGIALGNFIKFISSSSNIGNISGSNVEFIDNSTNNGEVHSENFSITNSINYSNILANAANINNIINYGSINGSTILFNNSKNFRTLNAGSIILDHESVNFNFGSITGQNLLFRNSSTNSGSINEYKECSFESLSANYNSLSTTSGDLNFGQAYNHGTINHTSGSIIFDKGSSNTSSINNISGTILFNNASFNNGYVFGKITFNKNSINSGQIDGDAVFNTASINYGSLLHNAVFNKKAINNAIISSNGIFNNSDNFGQIFGSGLFYNRSNSSGILMGSCIFNNSNNYNIIYGYRPIFSGSSNNYGTAYSQAVFFSSSKNFHLVQDYGGFFQQSYNYGAVEGNAVFSGNSINTVSGTVAAGYLASFLNNSYNYGDIYDSNFENNSFNYGIINGWNNYFKNQSRNDISGIIYGNATFENSSYNYGTIYGYANFDETSYNYGTVYGDCYGPGCS